METKLNCVTNVKTVFLPKCLIVCFQIYTFQQIAAHISDFHGKIQRNEGRLKAYLLTVDIQKPALMFFSPQCV